MAKQNPTTITDKVVEVIEQFEVPKELHPAIWKAFEHGMEYGFWKAVNDVAIPTLNKGKE